MPERATEPRRYGVMVGLGVAAAGGLLLFLAVFVLLTPNSVSVTTGSGDDIFFDCGFTVAPATRPAEEPGSSACRQHTADMRRAALLLSSGGLLLLGGGGLLLRSSWRRQT